MEKQLKKHGMKITPQRLELIKTLREVGTHHPSFSEVYNAIKSKYPNISRSTLFNNLKSLVELDLIRSFNYKGETHYELNLELHVNVIEPNGTIRDIENEEIRKHLREIVKIINKEGKSVKNLTVISE